MQTLLIKWGWVSVKEDIGLGKGGTIAQWKVERTAFTQEVAGPILSQAALFATGFDSRPGQIHDALALSVCGSTQFSQMLTHPRNTIVIEEGH